MIRRQPPFPDSGPAGTPYSLMGVPAVVGPVLADSLESSCLFGPVGPVHLDHQAAILISARAGDTMSRVMQKVKEKIGG